jgi:hypothetical protein
LDRVFADLQFPEQGYSNSSVCMPSSLRAGNALIQRFMKDKPKFILDRFGQVCYR